MSKIVNLSSYELVITYSWHKNSNHGICGHTYEVIDYFYILNKYFKCCIFLGELQWNVFEKILDKYNFSNNEIKIIKENTICKYKPLILKGNNILIVDGGHQLIENNSLFFKSISMFPCGNRNIPNTEKNINIFADTRIYKFGEHYVKKILLSKLKTPKKSKKRTLLYGTSNCRLISLDYINKLNDKYLIIQDFKNETNNNIEYKIAPVDNIFEEFDKYVYTSVPRKFDCSPRFIVECKYFNKEVIYDLDYEIEEDIGLYWRLYDIKNNFKSLELNNNDNIIKLLSKVINV